MKRNIAFAFAAVICGDLLFNVALGHTWTPLTNAPNQQWQAVASSEDGSKLVAVAYGGGVYTSTKLGLTRTSNKVPANNWYSVASSADGTKLVAVVTGYGGPMCSSTDEGANWAVTGAPSSQLQSWRS